MPTPPIVAQAKSQQKLRFLSRGTAMVPHYEAQKGNVRRFHGWKHDSTLGPKFKVLDHLGRETEETKHHGGFVKQIAQVTAVGIHSEFAGEYIRHLRDGDLWPADEFTARVAKVKFDPDYGGEHSEGARADQTAALEAARQMSVEATSGATVETTEGT